MPMTSAPRASYSTVLTTLAATRPPAPGTATCWSPGRDSPDAYPRAAPAQTARASSQAEPRELEPAPARSTWRAVCASALVSERDEVCRYRTVGGVNTHRRVPELLAARGLAVNTWETDGTWDNGQELAWTQVHAALRPRGRCEYVTGNGWYAG
eukprot:419617-Prymnesium_polylepis.1